MWGPLKEQDERMIPGSVKVICCACSANKKALKNRLK